MLPHAPVAQWIEQPPPKGQVGRSIRLRGATALVSTPSVSPSPAFERHRNRRRPCKTARIARQYSTRSLSIPSYASCDKPRKVTTGELRNLTLWQHGMPLPRRAPAMDAGSRVLVFDHAARREERRTTRTSKASPSPASDQTSCRSSGPLQCRLRRFGPEGWRTHRDAKTSCSGWCHMRRVLRNAARCRQTLQGLKQGVASGADEFGRGSGTIQSRRPWVRPTTVGSRNLCLKQIRADGALATLPNTLLDLANLGCC